MQTKKQKKFWRKMKPILKKWRKLMDKDKLIHK